MSAALDAIRARIGGRHGFVHSVGTLAGGTAFAQAIGILALPIVTRLYTPAEFSVLAVYASLLAIFSVAACLRLEIAIPMPERDEDAASLFALALCSSAVIAALLGVVFLLFPQWIAARLGVPVIETYLWMVPLGIWVASSYAAVQHWSTRKKKFSRIARTRMAQALGGAGTQVGAGLAGVGPFGLLLGHMISGGVGVFALARDAWREDGHALRSVRRQSMRDMLRQYSRFPKYSTMEALANSVGIQVPVIIIAALAIGPEAGYLMLATRVMAAPMGLIGGAVGQVYLSRAPEELRSGRLGDFTSQVLGGLSKSGVGPLLFAGIVAAPVFTIVFGVEWRRAGELVGWMTPWFVLQFLSSPVSMVMHVTNRQRMMLLVTVLGLSIRLGAMWLAYTYARSEFSEFYAISGASFYLLCCIVFYRAAGIGMRSWVSALSSGLVPAIAWVMAGVIVRMIAGRFA